MRVLVDYRCSGCAGSFEAWVERPARAELECPACREPARRTFSTAGLGGRRSAPTAPVPRSGRDDAALCLENSTVPGICHLQPSAARRWAAMARGDDAAVTREIRYQEAAIEAGTLKPGDAVAAH